jgi:hypothetical protein
MWSFLNLFSRKNKQKKKQTEEQQVFPVKKQANSVLDDLRRACDTGEVEQVQTILTQYPQYINEVLPSCSFFCCICFINCSISLFIFG